MALDMISPYFSKDWAFTVQSYQHCMKLNGIFNINFIPKGLQQIEWPCSRFLFYLCLLREASTSPGAQTFNQKDRAYIIVSEFNDGKKNELNNKCCSSRRFFCSGQMDLQDSNILVCLQPLTITDKILIKKCSSKILEIFTYQKS